MQINFNNYISSKTDSKFASRNQLVNIQQANQNSFRQFLFGITTDVIFVVNQARTFATYFSGSGYFENSYFNNSNRTDSIGDLLENCYIYSYIKSIYYAFGLVRKDTSAMLGPRNNVCFYGHKVLHDLIVEGQMLLFCSSNTTIAMQINLQDDIITDFLSSFDIWTEIYDPVTGIVYNAEYETALGFMHSKLPAVLATGKIGEQLCVCAHNVAQSPLGNMAFSSDSQQLLYVEDIKIKSDQKSFYWNKACLIKSIVVPIIDADDEVYETVLTDNYDLFGYGFEVEAITGYNPYGRPKTASSLSRRNGIPPAGPRPDDTQPGPGSGPNNNNNRGNRNQNGRNPRGQRTQLNSVREARLQGFSGAVVKVSKSAVNILRRTEEILDDDRVNVVAGVISQLLNKDVRPRSLRRFIGMTINQVLQNYDIVLNDRTIGDTSEYDAFYLERNPDNIELVGRQKYITQ